ncbi:MAG TPA: class I SAM-dependent methyltransferase, partial [Polyangiaceae bacterium]
QPLAAPPGAVQPAAPTLAQSAAAPPGAAQPAAPPVAQPLVAPPSAAQPAALTVAQPAAALPVPPAPVMTPAPHALRPGAAGAATSYPPPSTPPPPVKTDSIAVHAIRVINIGVDDTALPPPPAPLTRSDGDDFENIEDYAEEEFEPPPDSLDEADVQALTEDEPSLPKPPAPPAEGAPPPSTSAPSTDVKLPPPPKRQAPSPPKKKGPRAPAKKRKPWWEEVFSEDFARATHHLSNRHIRREVDFIDHSLGVAQGAVVLDLACGTGEHSIELASRGYSVVGYDLSVYQLAIAGETAQERELKINFLQGDMREMAFQEMFDGIFCWNTSFGYFEEEKNVAVAERIFQALRPGGMFLIDVVNRDHVMQHQPSQVWFQGDACVCMDDMSVDYITSRLRVKRSIIMDDGRTRECFYSIRLYTLHELGKLLHAVGFRVVEASGHPTTPGVYLGPNSPRVIILAQRP